MNNNLKNILVVIAVVVIVAAGWSMLRKSGMCPFDRNGNFVVMNSTITVPGDKNIDIAQPILVDTKTGNTWLLAQPEGMGLGWYPVTRADGIKNLKPMAKANNNPAPAPAAPPVPAAPAQ
ncbi:MAG: hypothetical protein AB7U41_01655 [Dongiaceae bacterium]